MAQNFRGLENYGATCYINATLQAFIHSPVLRLLVEFVKTSDATRDMCELGEVNNVRDFFEHNLSDAPENLLGTLQNILYMSDHAI